MKQIPKEERPEGRKNKSLVDDLTISQRPASDEISSSQRPVSQVEAKAQMGGLMAEEKSDLSCGTLKASWHKAEHTSRFRSAGVFATVYPCGIIFSLRELYGTESISQVVCILLSLSALHKGAPKVLGYDDACHLHKFIHLPKRATKYVNNILWQGLSRMKLFVDRFHYGNHVDEWCLEHMDPERPDIVQFLRVFGADGVETGKVNTQICEETFSWLQAYKNTTRHMGEARFQFFLITICWMRNKVKIRELRRRGNNPTRNGGAV